MQEKEHKHDFKLVETPLLIHKYRTIKGKRVKVGAATARDILRQFVCKCGFTETFDLKRRVI